MDVFVWFVCNILIILMNFCVWTETLYVWLDSELLGLPANKNFDIILKKYSAETFPKSRISDWFFVLEVITNYNFMSNSTSRFSTLHPINK